MKETIIEIANWAAEGAAKALGICCGVWGLLTIYVYYEIQNCIQSGTYTWTELIDAMNRKAQLQSAMGESLSTTAILLIGCLVSVIVYLLTLTKKNTSLEKEES